MSSRRTRAKQSMISESSTAQTYGRRNVSLQRRIATGGSEDGRLDRRSNAHRKWKRRGEETRGIRSLPFACRLTRIDEGRTLSKPSSRKEEKGIALLTSRVRPAGVKGEEQSCQLRSPSCSVFASSELAKLTMPLNLSPPAVSQI